MRSTNTTRLKINSLGEQKPEKICDYSRLIWAVTPLLCMVGMGISVIWMILPFFTSSALEMMNWVAIMLLLAGNGVLIAIFIELTRHACSKNENPGSVQDLKRERFADE